jgi:hypothetical protein
MVNSFATALLKEAVDVTAFKPNHLATLSVYYAKFLGVDNSKSTNGLTRWCYGLPKYVPGGDIEAEEDNVSVWRRSASLDITMPAVLHNLRVWRVQVNPSLLLLWSASCATGDSVATTLGRSIAVRNT